MDTFWQFGGNVSNLIFWLSSFLTKPEMPGWIVLLIVLALAVLMMMAWHSAQTKLNAIQWLESAVEKTKDEVNFAAEVPRIGAEATKRRNEKGYRHITAAWDEFRETFIVDETVQPPVLRNSIRPSAFFNVEDLHCGPGFYRLLPGLFVTIGLFLTFLGLISALQAISIDADASAQDMRKALNALLGAASAKFIMSLTGLLSSILFTIFLRICFTDRIEAKIHRLCVLLEERLSFISLEDLAMRQLEIARGQEEVFKRIGLELVEKLGEPLRKEVPDRIASSIQTAMGPLLDQVGKAGASGVDQMVGDLSKRLSEDVGRALSEASTQLSAAAEKIAILSERMDQSSGQMGREMENYFRLSFGKHTLIGI